MAESVLILAVLVFAVRGMFLGFVGVISRVVGIALAYYLTYSYRERVTQYVIENTQFDIAPIVLQIGSGLCLFFGTVIMTGFVISLAARVLSKISPSIKALLDNEAPGSRILGAVSNSLVGAAMVLLGIWAYDLIAQKPTNDSELHSVAKTFGETILTLVDTNTVFSDKALKQTDEDSFSSNAKETSNKSGTAYIISEENPDKKFAIEKGDADATEMAKPHKSPTQQEQSKLFSNDKVQDLLNNPRLKSIITKQIEENPEQIEKILTNPLIKELLEKSTTN